MQRITAEGRINPGPFVTLTLKYWASAPGPPLVEESLAISFVLPHI
jgi:hypothetical protein